MWVQKDSSEIRRPSHPNKIKLSSESQIVLGPDTRKAKTHVMNQEIVPIFVGNLAISCTEMDLMTLFSPYGIIVYVRIMKTKKQLPLGYAFVALSSIQEANIALQALDKVIFQNHQLRLSLAVRNIVDKNPTPVIEMSASMSTMAIPSCVPMLQSSSDRMISDISHMNRDYANIIIFRFHSSLHMHISAEVEQTNKNINISNISNFLFTIDQAIRRIFSYSRDHILMNHQNDPLLLDAIIQRRYESKVSEILFILSTLNTKENRVLFNLR